MAAKEIAAHLALPNVESLIQDAAAQAGFADPARLARSVVLSHLGRWPRVDALVEYLEDLRITTNAQTHTALTETALSALKANCQGLPAVSVLNAVATFCHERCESNGLAIAAITNTGGMRTLDVWSRYISNSSLIALVCWNGGPYAVVPFGGTEAFFGTNPFSFGIPGRADPVVADFATSQIAYMDLKRSLANHDPLPPGAGVDGEGRATDDPRAVFLPPDSARLTPMGAGPKGSALTMLVEVLAGAFSGGVMGRAASQEYRAAEFSGCVLAIKADLFEPGERFLAATSGMFDQIRLSRPARDHDDVRLPGDRALELYKIAGRDGVPVSQRFLEIRLAVFRAEDVRSPVWSTAFEE